MRQDATSGDALDLVGVSKRYLVGGEEVVALHEVDLTIGPGELITLLGPSGSGKTTLLSIAGGLLRPTSGRVVVAGQDITRARTRRLTAFRRRHVGFIFQAVNLVPFLTARENLLVVAELAGRRWGRDQTPSRRADQLLHELSLGHRAHNLPSQLSGGERQRVAIGRALMNDPTLVLVDEPTSALDSALGQQVMELISAELRGRGAAAVVVTHDPRMARYGDRILNMADGHLVTPDLTPDLHRGPGSTPPFRISHPDNYVHPRPQPTAPAAHPAAAANPATAEDPAAAPAVAADPDDDPAVARAPAADPLEPLRRAEAIEHGRQPLPSEARAQQPAPHLDWPPSPSPQEPTPQPQWLSLPAWTRQETAESNGRANPAGARPPVDESDWLSRSAWARRRLVESRGHVDEPDQVPEPPAPDGRRPPGPTPGEVAELSMAEWVAPPAPSELFGSPRRIPQLPPRRTQLPPRRRPSAQPLQRRPRTRSPGSEPGPDPATEPEGDQPWGHDLTPWSRHLHRGERWW
jgi:hemin transport system ATP-binding protein